MRPLCFGSVGSVRVIARPQSANTGARGPDLLAVQHPLVAVAHGACGDRGQVRSGRRLAEQLAAEFVHPHERLR